MQFGIQHLQDFSEESAPDVPHELCPTAMLIDPNRGFVYSELGADSFLLPCSPPTHNWAKFVLVKKEGAEQAGLGEMTYGDADQQPHIYVNDVACMNIT